MSTQQLLLGVGAAKKKYIDQVFHIEPRDGDNSSNKTVNTGEMGSPDFVWIKCRETSYDHLLYYKMHGEDSGVAKSLHQDSSVLWPDSDHDLDFTSTGYSIRTNDGAQNANNSQYIDWSWKKDPDFMDIVTWSGNGNDSQTISFDLKAGLSGFMIIARCHSHSSDTYVYHHKLNNGSGDLNRYMRWGSSNGSATFNNSGNWDVDENALTFKAQKQISGSGDNEGLNGNGRQYQAMIFAESAAWGDNADQKIISTGNYTGDGGDDVKVDCGFEPQYVMVKSESDNSGSWSVFDHSRDMCFDVKSPRLAWGDSGAENDNNYLGFTRNGFQLLSGGWHVNRSGTKYIYMAIRKPDGLVVSEPTAPSKVFAVDTGNTNSTIPAFNSDFRTDFYLQRSDYATSGLWRAQSRHQAKKFLSPKDDRTLEAHGYMVLDSNHGAATNFGSNDMAWMFRAGRGFNVVHYEGLQNNNDNYPHYLGGTPEMIWVKNMNTANKDWMCWFTGDTDDGDWDDNYYIQLNKASQKYGTGGVSAWGTNGNPHNATTFRVGNHSSVNDQNQHYMACLWRSIAGYSKIGAFTGSDSSLTITCGFQPSFLIIKCVNADTTWGIWDYYRGFDMRAVFGSESNAGHSNEGTISRTSTSFTLPGNKEDFNDNGRYYVYYAHA